MMLIPDFSHQHPPSSTALVVSETVTASHTELRATFDICERPFRDLGRTLEGEHKPFPLHVT